MEAILSFDMSVLDAIQQNLRCAFLDGFSLFFSNSIVSIYLWIALGVLLLFFRKSRYAGIILIAALALAFLTSDVLLKHLIARPRPFTVNTSIKLLVEASTSSSFPSTHSCLAAAAATVLLVKKRWLGVIALVWALCIAFSRLYLYVHYPTDVICGLLLGVICALVVLWIGKLTKLENKLSK